MNYRVLIFLRVLIAVLGSGLVALAAIGDISWYVRYLGPLDLMLIANGIGLVFVALILGPSGYLLRAVRLLVQYINAQPNYLKTASIFLLSAVMAAGWVMLMEGLLTLGMSHAQDQYYATLAEANKPCRGVVQPAGSVSIAVFGESSAAGWGANESFAQIMERELPLRYTGHKFCITNFAGNGQWLHENMAVIAKFVIKDFDILIFYQGHNEFQPYYKNEVFIKPEFRGQPVPPIQFANLPFSKEPGVVQEIEKYSRLYSVLRRGLPELMGNLFGEPIKLTMVRPHTEFETDSWVTPEARNKVLTNWRADLEEISDLAQKDDKLVVLSSMPGSESYRPFFSVYKAGITESEVQDFQWNYQCGVAAYDKGMFSEAQECWARALAIDDQVAILNWRIGTLEESLGHRQRAREFWRRSIDQDGFMVRSITALHENSSSVAERYENVIYVDAVAAFREVEDLPIGLLDYDQSTIAGKLGRLKMSGTHRAYEQSVELFADPQHPSTLGHAVLAEVFMCALARNEPLVNYDARNSCVPLAEVGRRASEDFTSPDWIYKSIFWHLSLARMSSYPVEFRLPALQKLDRFGRSSYNTLIHALFRAVAFADKSAGVEVMNAAAAEMTPAEIAQALGTWCVSATLDTTIRGYGFGWSTTQSEFELIPATDS